MRYNAHRSGLTIDHSAPQGSRAWACTPQGMVDAVKPASSSAVTSQPTQVHRRARPGLASIHGSLGNGTCNTVSCTVPAKTQPGPGTGVTEGCLRFTITKDDSRPISTSTGGDLIPLIGPAAGAVARYDGMLAAIPDPSVLLAPLTMREAVLSSRIEGTQATVEEVLGFEGGHRVASPERTSEIEEVLRFRAAIRESEAMLANLPLSGRVLRGAHKTLLPSTRGEHKAPGEFRRVPNWIGPPGCSMDDAKYVPISSEKLDAAMSNWERYVHQDAPDLLVQAANLHVEFEALHPFLDGNGRLGRMLVPLFLWQRGLIRRPMFYISAYLAADRDVYYERLLAVSRDDDWTGWCKFFLQAVEAQAKDNLAKTQAILNLYDNMKDRVMNATRSQFAMRALDCIFSRPVFSSTNFADASGIPAPSAYRILAELRKHEILADIVAASGRRPAIVAFPALLDIVEGDDDF